MVVSVSGFRRSSLVEHVCDSFDEGIRRTEALICGGYVTRFLVYLPLRFFLGMLCIGVSPFVLIGGKRLTTDWFYFGCHFLALSFAAVAWWVLTEEAIRRAITRHKFPSHQRPYV